MKIDFSARRIQSTNSGFTLVEIVIAAAILAVVGLALTKILASLSTLSLRSRQEMRGLRLVKQIKVELEAIPFEFIFPFDSSLPNWGLGATRTMFEGNDVLKRILNEAQQQGFSRFKTEITYMRRDASNILGNGTNALIPFTDANGDKIDDYDTNIRYQDLYNFSPKCSKKFTDLNDDSVDDVTLAAHGSLLSSDGDYSSVLYWESSYGTFPLGEVPQTNLKLVKISLFSHRDKIKPFVVQEFLISAEKFSGIANTLSQERSLDINITIPALPRVLFEHIHGHQNTAQTMVLSQPYPAPAYRADSASALNVQGRTSPNTYVYVSTWNPPTSAVAAHRDWGLSDFMGNVTFNAPNTTDDLKEGENYLYFEAVKFVAMTGYVYQMRSAIGRLNVVWDIKRPKFDNEHPTSNNVKSLSPDVGVTFEDETVDPAAKASGICEKVISITVDPDSGSPVTYNAPDVYFDPASGKIKWRNPVNHLPVTLANNTEYDIFVEGGDFAHYGRDTHWDFKTNILTNDPTPPVVDNLFPPHLAVNVPSPVSIQCRVQDPQSGVDYSTLEVWINGLPVIDAVTTPKLGDIIDAETGVVSFPSRACPSGSTLNIRVKARHWGTTGIPAQDTVDFNGAWSLTCN